MSKLKNIIIICSILAFAGCKSKKNNASKKPAEAKVTVISPDKVDDEQKERAYYLGKRVLQTCNTSRFKPFAATEATETVRKNTTEERLTKTCHNFRLKYGDFKDIKLVEVVRDKKNKLTIYRYKADYEKKIANKELRVIMNDENLVSGIKSLDWTDKFN